MKFVPGQDTLGMSELEQGGEKPQYLSMRKEIEKVKA